MAEEGARTRGAHCTSVDAAFKFRNGKGQVELALVEWKYTESYRRKRTPEPEKDRVRTQRYGRLYAAEGGPLHQRIPLHLLFDARTRLIGAFTLAVCLAAVLFALWAAKYTTEKSYGEYDVVFQEAVTGLSVGSQVLYSGISVGAVRTLSLMKDDPRKVVARIRLNAETPVKTDTRAKLTVTGLTGTTVIQLTGGSPGAPILEGAQGRRDDVPVIPSEPSALQNIAATASEIVDRVNQLLSDENVARVTRTLDQLDQITGSISGEREEIASLIRNARAASEKLDQTLASADRTINNLDQGLVKELPELVAKLDRTLSQLESASQSADAILSDNREAIADFSQDGLAQVGPTMRQLRGLIRELDDLANRLEDNPAGFLLGKEQPEEFEP